MSKLTIQVQIPQHKRRAVELFSSETNFRPKIVENKKTYKRRQRHKPDYLR